MILVTTTRRALELRAEEQIIQCLECAPCSIPDLGGHVRAPDAVIWGILDRLEREGVLERCPEMGQGYKKIVGRLPRRMKPLCCDEDKTDSRGNPIDVYGRRALVGTGYWIPADEMEFSDFEKEMAV